MSATVIGLRTEPQVYAEEVRADIVETLELWLADAKAGKLRAVAMCAILKDGSTINNVPKHDEHAALIGTISMMLDRAIRAGVQSEDE